MRRGARPAGAAEASGSLWDNGADAEQDLARTLYVLALAQAGDEASVARRATLLAEAATVLDGLSLEAQQMQASRELIDWVAAARGR